MTRPRAWVDGAARGNPGEAGFGVVFQTAEGEHRIGGYLGETTNNVAEYCGLLAALGWAERQGLRDLVLHSDSQLVVRQLAGAYRVKAPHLKPLFEAVLASRKRLPGLEVRHVPREQNRAADALANRAIDERLAPPTWLALPRNP